MIGIFWLLPDLTDIYYMTHQPITEGEPYGDWIVSGDNHDSKWEDLKAAGTLQVLPSYYRKEYYRLPRGRVSYHTIQNKYYIFHGNWLKSKHKNMLCNQYDIKKYETVFMPDIHYTIREVKHG